MRITLTRLIATWIFAVFFFLCLLIAGNGEAQTASQYSFSTTQDTYQPLTGGIAVPNLAGGVSSSIPIGFTFNFAGVNYTDIIASDAGWISFNTNYTGTLLTNNAISSLNYISPVVFPLWDGLSGSVGNASYLTTGIPPNRVFTFEFQNWNWLTSNPAISFQVQLYETSNVVEFNYHQEPDDNYLSLSGPSASIGIASSSSDYLSLTNITNPSMIPIASATNFTYGINTKPFTGVVYTFIPPTACSGIPTQGSVAIVSPFSICSSGGAFTLIDTGFSAASGLNFQWQSSSNGGGSWIDIGGATDYFYQPLITSNILYRVKQSCLASSQIAYTPTLTVNVGGPIQYNSIPYFQDFENWSSYCGFGDIPDAAWTNNPASGNNSWRREDLAALGNWSNNFTTSYSPSAISGFHSARFHSSSASFNAPGNFDLHLDCSGQIGNKGIYFYYINDNYNGSFTDSLLVYISTNGGNNFSRLASFDTGYWNRVYLPLASNSSNTIVRFQGLAVNNLSGGDLGIDSIFIAAPCIGIPVAGSISPAGPISDCPGSSFLLSSVGATMAGDINYQWELSTNGGINWSSIPGANSFNLRIQGLYDTTLFRYKVTCNGSNQTAVSNVVIINVQTPNGLYASLPFIESFENWMNQCDSSDVPGSNGISSWTNSPVYGNGIYTNTPSLTSWRREDQGLTGGWNAPSEHMYYPSSVQGQHSARFYINQISHGTLDILLDCSSNANKELQFYLNLDVPQTTQNIYDSFKVYLSTDGGITFSRLESYLGTTNSGWELERILFTSNSAKTVIRFSAEMASGWASGVGLDLVKVLTPCSGQPVAGTVDSVSPCPNKEFFLHLLGTTESSDMSYEWQQSSNGTTWVAVPGGNNAIAKHSIAANTWYRCIVTCDISGLRDTTQARYIQLAPFYYCYCDASPFISLYAEANIGNVLIQDSVTNTTVLDNGNANPLQGNHDLSLYSDYQLLNPALFYRDTNYYIRFTETLFEDNFPPIKGKITAFIDYNRDGNYDPVTERLFSGDFTGHPNQVDSGYFTIPLNAQHGLTGMRCILSYNANWPDPIPQPCDYNLYKGEVEDYVVKIEYAPCSGAPNPGNAFISDMLVANGAMVQLHDITHDNGDALQASQLFWVWQSSTDSLSWSNIPASEMADTINQLVTIKTWFRLKVICQSSHDSSYSNAVYVDIEDAGVTLIPGVQFLDIYPNPTEGNIILKYQGTPQKQLVITVMDIAGKELIQRRCGQIDRDFSSRINLAGFAKGVYIIRVDFDQGRFSSRIILK